MEEKNGQKSHSEVSFAGVGLIFGTAFGAILSLLISCSVLWAGVGTAIGIIIGAIIDSQTSGKKK